MKPALSLLILIGGFALYIIGSASLYSVSETEQVIITQFGKPVGETIKDAGLHVKTAGTTWLEELIGLAEAGGEGLALVKEIYAYAMDHVDELTGPYATVIDIKPSQLPSAQEVNGWTSDQLTGALRHIQSHPLFNASFRQLLHVAFKIAAKKGDRYLNLLKADEAIVAKNVTENLYDRHLRPLFVG